MIVDVATGEIEDREPTPEEQGLPERRSHRLVNGRTSEMRAEFNDALALVELHEAEAVEEP